MVIILVCLNLTTWAAQYKYIGGSSYNFTDAANWSTAVGYSGMPSGSYGSYHLLTINLQSGDVMTIDDAGYTSCDFAGVELHLNGATLNIYNELSLDTWAPGDAGINFGGSTINVHTGAYLRFNSESRLYNSVAPPITSAAAGTINVKPGASLDFHEQSVLTMVGGLFNVESGGTVGFYQFASNTPIVPLVWWAPLYNSSIPDPMILMNNGTIYFSSNSYSLEAHFGGAGLVLLPDPFAPPVIILGPAVVVSPGNSPGIFTFDIGITFGTTNSLEIEIGGTSPGTQYDVLGGTGAKNLNGTLDIQLYNSWVPAMNDVYTIVTGPITGTFTTVNYPTLPAGLGWNLSYNANSVVLNIVPNAPTPITLIEFGVQEKEKKAYLNWTTAQETNNQGFEIERSSNGVDFKNIGFVQGQGNSSELNNYSFIDEEPLSGINYYRLKQLDHDGQYEYSPIKKVTIELTRPITIYPNPATNVLYVQGAKSSATYAIYNLTGRLVQTSNVHEHINVSQLKTGLYIIKITQANTTEELKFYKSE